MWLYIAAGLLFVLFLVILFSFISVGIDAKRENGKDEILLNMQALFGLITLQQEVPKIDFKGFFEGIEMELKIENESTGTTIKEQEKRITRRKLSKISQKIRLLLHEVHDLKPFMYSILRDVHCTQFIWRTSVGLGDAAATGMAAGFVWGIKSNVVGQIFKRVKLNADPKIEVKPFFQQACLATHLNCIFKIRVGKAIVAVLRFIPKILKSKGGRKAWRNILSRA